MKRQISRQVACILVGFSLLFLIAHCIFAQHVLNAHAGLVNYIEGEVFLEGNEFKILVGKYPQMQNGQTMKTKQGRAELILAPNIFLRLGENSLLRMENNTLVEAQLALEQGFALMEIVKTIKGNRARLLLSNGVVEASKAGLYRVDANPSVVRVYGGEAIVQCSGKKTKIKRERMVHLDGSLKPSIVDTTIADAFHQWAGKRSFGLFVDPMAFRKQTHWYVNSEGWLINSNYHMRFFSRVHYLDWARRQQKAFPEMERSTTVPSFPPAIKTN
jgi:hypothetical protein